MRSHHLARRGSGSERGCTTYIYTALGFSTVQVYINSEFPVLTESVKSISQECRQEAEEEILSWRDLKGLTDIDPIHSKLIYIVQGRVIRIKYVIIQLKYTHDCNTFL